MKPDPELDATLLLPELASFGSVLELGRRGAIVTLMNEATTSITDISFASGFTNLSDFNRQFLRQKGTSPSRLRRLLAGNAGAEEASVRDRARRCVEASARRPAHHAANRDTWRPPRRTSTRTGDSRMTRQDFPMTTLAAPKALRIAPTSTSTCAMNNEP